MRYREQKEWQGGNIEAETKTPPEGGVLLDAGVPTGNRTPAAAVKGQCSNRYTIGTELCGAPGAIRTPDPLVRSQILYPTELRVQLGVPTGNRTPAAAVKGQCSNR